MIESKDNTNDVQKKIKKILPHALKKIEQIIQLHSVKLASHVRMTYLTRGTTATRLKVRSGLLRASVKPIPTKKSKTIIKGGIGFGTDYAKPHIGKKGTYTTITPKNKKYLTIPFPGSPILTKAGVLKATAKELMSNPEGLPFGDTFIRGGIIFGTPKKTKGRNIGAKSGGIIPLFILKKKVKIPRRIDPHDILLWSEKQLIKDFEKEKIGMKSSGI